MFASLALTLGNASLFVEALLRVRFMSEAHSLHENAKELSRAHGRRTRIDSGPTFVARAAVVGFPAREIMRAQPQMTQVRAPMC